MDELSTGLPPGTGQQAADPKILIFSAEYDLRLLFKTLLEIWGYRVEESDCLETSLSIVKNDNPKMIILDSILPFEAGLEVIRQIRKCKYSRDIPIIVLSGFSTPKFRSLSLAVGATGFFVKPVDFDLLEICLKRNFEKNNQKKLFKGGI